MAKVADWRARVRMAQHALGSEDHKRLPPVAQGLTAQQMEILRGVRRLTDLEIVASRELQKAFDAGTGVLRSLTFIAVRQKQDQSGKQSPFVIAGADELIDHRLRNVYEVAQLRFP